MTDIVEQVQDAHGRIVNALVELGDALNMDDPNIRMACGHVAAQSQKTYPTDAEIAAFVKDLSVLGFRAVSLSLVFTGDVCYSMSDGEPMRFYSNEWKEEG
jgi:hypothetical protein